MESGEYRSEVFKLCNKLKAEKQTKELSSLISNMSFVEEDPGTGYIKQNSYGDFAYVAKRSNNQFHGFLFVDDNINTIALPDYLKVEKLSNNARFLIEQGDKTLKRFVELCTGELKKSSSILGEASNPYFLFKDVNYISAANSILKDEDLEPVVSAFKKGRVYRALVDTDATKILHKADALKMQPLMLWVEEEMKKSFGTTISYQIKKFALTITDRYENTADIMMALVILIYALKESLRMACQLLYEAIYGGGLVVLNNNNIINIEKPHNDIIGEKYKVLVQESSLKHISRNMGSVLLMDCDPTDVLHIHDFGMITAITESFACDMGNTIKYSFITVDDELINIHILTERIIEKGFPEKK